MTSQPRQGPVILTKSQYHHFIPRFLLRNFASETTTKSSAYSGKGKRAKKNYGSVELVNVLNFQDATFQQCPIAKEFGLVDMYRDQAILDQHDLEKKLSRLESQAGVIIAKARKALDNGSELVLTRFERDTIRKFFFMMKYRSSRFYQRFDHDSVDTYDADDRHRLVEFLAKRNLSSPKAVWFSNIHAFLDLQMDAEIKWIQKILDSPSVYPDDARMFIYHMQSKFMAFCTVSDMTDEFILSENAYGVHEGPVDCEFDPKSRKMVGGLYTEHHTFAPLSPKLLVVFRSFHLPTGFDEGDTQERERFYETMKNLHNDPKNATSILEDLPIEKCRNSYTVVVNGKMIMKPGPPEPRSKDKFFFRFFPLSTKHVQLINTIFLENAYWTSSMVCKSSVAMLKALRQFLEDPRPGFKVVENTSSDPRFKFLRKLETVAQRMGSQTKATYKVLEVPKQEVLEVPGYEGHMTHWVGLVVGLSCVKEDSDLSKLYGWLSKGATMIESFIDVDQACRMAFMAVRIDAFLCRSRVSPDVLVDIQLKRRDLFAVLPLQRVWLYLKVMRNMRNFDTNDFKKQIRPLELMGPEDFVAANLDRLPPHMAGQALFQSQMMDPMSFMNGFTESEEAED